MVTIRLARHGSKEEPFLSRHSCRPGARARRSFCGASWFLQSSRQGTGESLRLDLDRIDYWVGVGAQPSDRVKQLIGMARKQQSAAAATAE